jgi:hypothetical protein
MKTRDWNKTWESGDWSAKEAPGRSIRKKVRPGGIEPAKPFKLGKQIIPRVGPELTQITG